MRFALVAAALAGASAVVIGAANAHLASTLGPTAAGWLQTGLHWQTIHALALLGVAALAAATRPSRWLFAAGIAWIAGILLFSGSLYVMALTGFRDLGVLTPIGGLVMIVGWLLLLPHVTVVGRKT